jgi:outer membrane immunogenic protein
MKKIVLAALMTVAGAGSALAADLPVKAPPPPAPTSWSGFYIGAFGGWGWNGRNDWNCVSTFGEGCRGTIPALNEQIGINHSQDALSGGLAGGQIGYDWRWDRVVFGVQADGAWADIHGSSVNPFNLTDGRCGFSGTPDQTVDCHTTIRAMADLTARAGYLFWENTLIYGKFGINWSQINFQVSNDLAFSGTCGAIAPSFPGYNSNHIGRVSPTVGVGIEQRFFSGLSVFAEYDFIANGGSYTNLNTGGTGTPFSCTADFTSTTTIRDTNIVKAGINWTFDSGLLGAPLVAKY